MLTHFGNFYEVKRKRDRSKPLLPYAVLPLSAAFLHKVKEIKNSSLLLRKPVFLNDRFKAIICCAKITVI